jgi:hypothetical protein
MNEVRVNGKEVELNGQIVKLLDGLKYLEDIYDPGYFESLREKEKKLSEQILVTINSSEEIKITWK